MKDAKSKGKEVVCASYDQSASFDMVEPTLLIEKLKYFSVSEKSREWIKSFLSNRTQKVRVGSARSEAVKIPFGTPQGAILSPLLFLIYVSDIDLWIDEKYQTSYCDDTNVAIIANTKELAVKELEKVSAKLMTYFASNFLVANASKTSYMVVRTGNNEEHETKLSLKVAGSEIEESKTMEMLGLTLSNNLKWDDHINKLIRTLKGVNGLLSRLAAHVPRQSLLPVVHGLLLSRIRYGLAVFGETRTQEEDPTHGLMSSLQKEMNKALRLVCGRKICDRVTIDSLLQTTKTKSVNHMVAESQLREIWRSLEYGLPLSEYLPTLDNNRSRITRLEGSRHVEVSRENTYQSRLAKLWNTLSADARQEGLRKSCVFKQISAVILDMPL